MSMKLFTIGVSKKSAESFFDLLKKNNIKKIIDIRLNNKSQLLGFSKEEDLKYFCEKCHSIEYAHEPLLAPTKEILEQYRKTKDWSIYEAEFNRTIELRSIIDIFKKIIGDTKNICLLCSEESSKKCHRRLVAEYIAKRQKEIEVVHL